MLVLNDSQLLREALLLHPKSMFSHWGNTTFVMLSLSKHLSRFVEWLKRAR